MIFAPPTQPAIDELEWFRFSICRVEELQGIPLIVSRTGYTGELGYEIWCHPKDAPKVWDKLMEYGKEDNLIPAGFAALDKLRIEAGLILFGNEFDGHVGRSQVGVITSGCLSTTLNKNIALCRIDNQYSEIGTEVEVGKIDGHQKRISAKVVAFPHFDPKKTRVRS